MVGTTSPARGSRMTMTACLDTPATRQHSKRQPTAARPAIHRITVAGGICHQAIKVTTVQLLRVRMSEAGRTRAGQAR